MPRRKLTEDEILAGNEPRWVTCEICGGEGAGMDTERDDVDCSGCQGDGIRLETPEEAADRFREELDAEEHNQDLLRERGRRL